MVSCSAEVTKGLADSELEEGKPKKNALLFTSPSPIGQKVGQNQPPPSPASGCPAISTSQSQVRIPGWNSTESPDVPEPPSTIGSTQSLFSLRPGANVIKLFTAVSYDFIIN
jgi:hypothetical protein